MMKVQFISFQVIEIMVLINTNNRLFYSLYDKMLRFFPEHFFMSLTHI